MKNKNSQYYLLSALTLISTLTSCTKIIDVEFKDATPQLVVSGNITDQAEPYTVKLSKTVNYTADNIFPTVSGAQVIVRDNVGNSETLTETTSGNYIGTTLLGTAGRTYSISIVAEGKTYSGETNMPTAVSVDDLTVQNEEGGTAGENSKTITVHYKDPLGKGNYYRFILFVNGIQQNNIYVAEDRFTDGIEVKEGLQKDSLQSGDSISVVLQTIDKKIFNYFYTLQQLGEGHIFVPLPSNPVNNLNNNALGYFSACSERTSATIIVP